MPSDSGTLWAITSYFNPAGYRRRLQNYQVFRRHLTVPLVTVELSFDGRFQLSPGDADILVQLHSGDIMWQKERLLNLALRQVTTVFDKIAWLDCDVIFGSDDWADRACEALEDVVLVHLFHERHDLPPDFDLDELGSWQAEPLAFSAIYRLATHQASPDDFRRTGAASLRTLRSTRALAWAARRDTLEGQGFYDACILGGGDIAIVCAALQRCDDATQALRLNGRRREHYLAWAHPFFATIRGRVGHIPGRIFHLWHGDLSDRQYAERYLTLEDFDFDPFTDIALDDQECWRWSSHKPGLHAAVRSYFASRREDGRNVR